MKNPTPRSAKPPIDRGAELAQQPAPPAQATQAAPGPQPGDPLMPTVENEPPFVFTPGPGITARDVMEITLMTWLQLTGSTVEVQKGALAAQALSPDRVAALSDSARKHMSPLGQH